MPRIPRHAFCDSIVADRLRADCAWAAAPFRCRRCRASDCWRGPSVALTALAYLSSRACGRPASWRHAVRRPRSSAPSSRSIDILNYFWLTVAGPPLSDVASADRRSRYGLDWPALMAWMAGHPHLWRMQLLRARVYIGIAVADRAAVGLPVLGSGEAAPDLQLCVSRSRSRAGGGRDRLGRSVPSFGAFSVYQLPPQIAAHLRAGARWPLRRSELVGLLQHGPGRIAPDQLHGLIGFPSFHTVLADSGDVVCARHSRYLRWPALVLNCAGPDLADADRRAGIT